MAEKTLSPQEEALKYLEKHRIPKLMDFIGAKLAYFQPEDVNAFLKAELQNIVDAKANGKKYTLYEENDIIALFASFDITQRGYLTQQQYEKGTYPHAYRHPNSSILS
jgi:non-homologous end joining protein Ku